MTIEELIISESSLTFLVRLMIVFKSSYKPHDHLGASYYNIGRIQTKENIAVVTLLISSKPNSLGASWSYLNHILTPFGSDLDCIRIRVVKNLTRSFGGFLFKHRSYSNQREHSCRYPLDRRNAKLTRELLDHIRIIA